MDFPLLLNLLPLLFHISISQEYDISNQGRIFSNISDDDDNPIPHAMPLICCHYQEQ